jgi:hypothetical protein
VDAFLVLVEFQQHLIRFDFPFPSLQVRVVQWNKDQGWIACGCDDGLLKVLKLDPLSQPKQYEFWIG